MTTKEDYERTISAYVDTIAYLLSEMEIINSREDTGRELEAKILNYCVRLPKEQQESFKEHFGITSSREGKIESHE